MGPSADGKTELMAIFAYSNLYFNPPKSDPVYAVRTVRGSNLGKLITVRGIVTRVSEVKPLLLVNAFSCESCEAEVFQEVDGRQITPLEECISDKCRQDGAKGRLFMQTRACKFAPFQEVRIQEMVSLLDRRQTLNVPQPLCIADDSL
jgi:DNA replication licensing factor MCM7